MGEAGRVEVRGLCGGGPLKNAAGPAGEERGRPLLSASHQQLGCLEEAIDESLAAALDSRLSAGGGPVCFSL
jgi:hypothetical protein